MIYQLQNQEYDGSLPLVSILLLSYNNTEYLPESLTSIFRQSYPNIEVLIGDDGSAELDAAAIMQWVEAHRTENIRNIQLVQNETNVGTVANLENLVALSKGEFLFPIAADDAMYDAEVIARFYEEAAKHDEDALIFTAETELWDNKLEHRTGAFLRPDIIELIKNGTSEQMLEALSRQPWLPACNFYRRRFYQRIGDLSGKYRLVEDWPAHLIAARMGIRFHYVDMPSSIKHRDGGISHNSNRTVSKARVWMMRDLANAYLYEIQPYEWQMQLKARKMAKAYFVFNRQLYFSLLWKYLKKREKSDVTDQALREWELADNDDNNRLTVRTLQCAYFKACEKAFFHQISRMRAIAVTILLLGAAYIAQLQMASVSAQGAWRFRGVVFFVGAVLLVQLIAKTAIALHRKSVKNGVWC